MSEVKVVNLTKKFGAFKAVDDISISFPQGKVTCLLGPSGCGKTTLLRMISGLESPTSGSIFFGDIEITELPPRKRNIGMVFQYPVVYRGISVRKNIELPLLKEKLTESERRSRIDEALDLMNLHEFADKDSSELDNVSRQKVSVARAVAYRPDIILFDEPMTNIDANSKIQFKHAFKSLTRKLNQVIVYVTHDQTEAMTLADQIALMEDGRIVQCNDPRNLYNNPVDLFGGWFLGNPGMNFIEEECVQRNGSCCISSDLLKNDVELSIAHAGKMVTIGIRPEHVKISKTPTPYSVEALVHAKTLTVGGQYLYTLEIGERRIKVKTDHSFGSSDNEDLVWVELPLDHIVLFDGNKKRIDTEIFAQQKD